MACNSHVTNSTVPINAKSLTTANGITIGTGASTIGVNSEDTLTINSTTTFETPAIYSALTSFNNDVILGNGATDVVVNTGYMTVNRPLSVMADEAATLLIDQVVNAVIVCAPTAGRILTLPSAVTMVSNLSPAIVGQTFLFWVRNEAAGANSLTIAAGTGGTLRAGNTNTIAQANTRLFVVQLTNITALSEAYIVISLGASAH